MSYGNTERSKELKRATTVRGRQKVKMDVLNHYSNGNLCCAFCGASDLAVLCLDHINNDGAKRRKGVQRGGVPLYYSLRKQSYPLGLQVLCYNCNAKKENERVSQLLGVSEYCHPAMQGKGTTRTGDESVAQANPVRANG